MKPPSARNADFLDKHARQALEEILDHERPPQIDETCASCSHPFLSSGSSVDPSSARYRCPECFSMPHLCAPCVLKVHAFSPFHRLQRWDPDQGFWHKASAAELGLVLYAGHGGRACPLISRPPRAMVIAHAHGLTKFPVSFCECTHPEAPRKTMQLLRLGLYPASWSLPRTAFTLDLMRDFHLLSLQGNLTAQDFCTYLARCTDNVRTQDVPDRYREFMASMREFSFLRACKRAAQQPTRQLPPRSLAVLCPACPQPGMNMRPGWEKRLAKFGYLDALYYAIDGNYHQHQRKKPLDPNDFALTLGAAYFANEQDFRAYVSLMGEVPPEESTCNKFGAIGPGGYTHPVSGILALSCRHELLLPQSIIDLISNEKAYIVDFAVVSAAQPYVTLKLFKQYYDVGCQYMVRFPLRMKSMAKHLPALSSISTVDLPTIHSAVPAFHQYAHCEQCQSFQSPNCLPGSGKYDGETNERKWNQTNIAALRAREMVSGGRHDFINDLLSDLNIRNVHGIAQVLVHKHDDAMKYLTEAEEYLTSVEDGIPANVLRKWVEEEDIWLARVVDMRNHKTLDNPFVAPKAEMLSKASISDSLKASTLQEASTYGMELVGAIEGMLDLEHERSELLDKVHSIDHTKARQCSALAARVRAFTTKAQMCNDIYCRYVNPFVAQAYQDDPPLALPVSLPWRDLEDDQLCGIPTSAAAPARAKLTDTMLLAMERELDDIDIYLPSLYHSLIRKHPALQAAVEVERKLREGQAHDALNNLRLALMASYSLKNLATQGAGQAHGQRVRDLEQTHRKAGNKARDEYRQIRNTMIVLGMPRADKTFPELTDADCQAIAESRHRGESRTTRSWLWADLSILSRNLDSGVKTFMIKHSRPHWFRCRAAKARWEEEVFLKREEMYRTLLFFRRGIDSWTSEAQAASEGGRLGAAVYSRRYERVCLQMITRATQCILDRRIAITDYWPVRNNSIRERSTR
ncbi:hypothetical protein C8Q76DRAFT_611678 [Earliella scabrosa]|nr:hypothetical protein C8Q76DRAFT_611678 [Earliella scabrosa]